MQYKIYIDMDGVLANFERGVRELCGVIPPDQDEAFVSGSDEEMWAGIRSVPHFSITWSFCPVQNNFLIAYMHSTAIMGRS